jgi:hypothetical protein
MLLKGTYGWVSFPLITHGIVLSRFPSANLCPSDFDKYRGSFWARFWK